MMLMWRVCERVMSPLIRSAKKIFRLTNLIFLSLFLQQNTFYKYTIVIYHIEIKTNLIFPFETDYFLQQQMVVMTLIRPSLDQYSVEREHTAGERKSPEVEGHQTPNTKPLSLSFRYFYVDNNLTKIYEK